MQLEKGENHREKSMPRSHTYAGRETDKVRGVEFYGIPEVQGHPDDIRKISRIKVQISLPGILT